MQMVINDLYRFWFDIPGKGLTQVFPFNSQIKFTDKRKSGYRFYQRTMDSPLIMKDAPAEDNFGFTHLMDLERQGMTCEQVDVIIDKYCECNDTWTEGFYTGYLRLNAGEWDVSDCTVVIPVVVKDKFTCLTTSWTNEVNMFDYGDPTVTVSPFVGVIQRIECGPELYHKHWDGSPSWSTILSYVTNFFNTHLQYDCLTDVTPNTTNHPWTLIQHTHITQVTFNPDNTPPFFGPGSTDADINIKTEWAREFVAGATQPPGYGWVAVTGGWARQINVVSAGTLDHTTPEGQEALQTEWGTDQFNIGMLQRWQIVGEDANGNSTFVNGKELGPLLEDLLAPCELTIVSNFLNINPDGTNPDNDYYTRAQTDFHGIVLYQISDIARIDETQSATIAIMKLKELIDALKVAGNMDVDVEGSTLRIEHVSYWPEEVQMDLTLSDFYYLIKDRWKYTYDELNQPKKEIIAWDHETDFKGNDFDGYPIEYDNACVNDQDEKNDQTYQATHYLSNLLKIIANEDYYDDTETIVMVSTTNGVINSALQPISGYTKLNGNLAMGYLIPRYYDYARPFKEGYINKNLTPFYSLVRNRLQAPITIPFQCDDYMNNYSPGKLIKTQLGGCQIETATYTDPDETMEFKLRGK